MVTPPTTGLAVRATAAGSGRRRGRRVGGAAAGGLRRQRRRTISRAPRPALSSRSPLNTGWRSWPSPVHSLKATSATSEGEVQCTPRAWAPLGGSENGGVCRSSARRRFASRASVSLVEPAADAAGVAQGALLVVDAEQEGAEPVTRSGRLGEAADDELLAAAALGLEPRARAPARSRRRRRAWTRGPRGPGGRPPRRRRRRAPRCGRRTGPRRAAPRPPRASSLSSRRLRSVSGSSRRSSPSSNRRSKTT